VTLEHQILGTLREAQKTLDQLIAEAANKTPPQKKARRDLIIQRDRVMLACDALVTRQFKASTEKVVAAQARIIELTDSLKQTKATLNGIADAAGIAGDVLVAVTAVISLVL
jgi:hypothetical protein